MVGVPQGCILMSRVFTVIVGKDFADDSVLISLPCATLRTCRSDTVSESLPHNLGCWGLSGLIELKENNNNKNKIINK